MIEATSSAPGSATDGPAEGGAGKGASASDPTGALFAMLLAGMVAPAPQAQTPTPTGGKGATAEANGPALTMPAVGPLAADQDAAALATAAAGAGQAAAAATAAGERNGVPVKPDTAGEATGSAAPVERGKGKHTLGPAGRTGEPRGPRAGHGRRAAAEAPALDATATAAPAATAPATGLTAGGSTTAQGQQTPQEQQSRQDQPEQGDVRVDALANVTSTSTATPTPHLAHAAHAAAPAVEATRQATATPIASFTQDHARFEHLVEGLSAKLHLSRSEGGSSLRMTLRPEELGQVTVRLQVGADGTTTASVTADSQQAASLLADSADDLRQALADRGLQLDKLDVQSGGGSTLGDARPDSQQPGQADRDGNAPRSFYSFRAETEAAVTAAAVDAREGETGHSYLA